MVLDSIENEFSFEGLFSPVTLSLNRGFSAPVIIEHSLTDDDLIKLIGDDTDLFNRWDAIQQYSYKTIHAWVNDKTNF